MISVDFCHWHNGSPINANNDYFGVWLFLLISKADGMQRAKLRFVYPHHVNLYERVMEADPMFSEVTQKWIEARMKEWEIPDC